METFILFTLKSSLCLSACFLFYYLLLRRDTFHRFKRFVLLGIILLSVVVPLAKIKVGPAVLNFPMQTIESTILNESPQVVTVQKTIPLPVEKPVSRPINILLVIYLAGASAQLILIFFSLTKILLLLSRSKKTDYGWIHLALTPENVSPFCFGRRIVIS